MDRRTFIKGVGAGLAVGAAGSACAREGSKLAIKKPSGSSRVAVMVDDKVRLESGFDAGRVKQLLDKTIQAACGSQSGAGGLSSLFKKDDVVGIKLNCLAGPPLSPTKEFCNGLVELFNQAGIASEQIVFFERAERDIRKGGFKVKRGSGQPAYLGNDSSGAGYEEEVTISGQVGSCLSKILTKRITAMVNVGVLKDHNLAGVGVGMKNLFGLIHNPNKFHDNGCDPYVADVLAFEVIQKKLKLVLVDGLTAQCNAGPGYFPGYAWPFNGLMASIDPVALDRVAWDILEKQRAAQGLPSLTKEKRAPKWIHTAAKRGLGLDDLKKIKIIKES
ncbi:MAG: DUF362 domain-containing protein [Deltaproteobacteria bacterium]|nr:DUF362 domain-containing protein [Deltaproteobacteria bacterium]